MFFLNNFYFNKNNNSTVNTVINVAAVVSDDSLSSCDILIFMTFFVNLAVLTNTNMSFILYLV